MNTTHGFTLTEVMVSLLLMTTTSLALLKNQWHLNQSLNHTQLQTLASTQLENASEQLLAGLHLRIEDPRFKIEKAVLLHQIIVKITCSKAMAYDCRVLKRRLVIL